MNESDFVLIAGVPVLLLIIVVLFFTFKPSAKRRPVSPEGNPNPPPPQQKPAEPGVPGAIAISASSFDRDMYIDDMTLTQLEDEYVYRTIYILVAWMSRHNIKPTTLAIAELVTGRAGDAQLFGLSEYYADTEYEIMWAKGDDRYWKDELAPMGVKLSHQKKCEILAGGFLVDALYQQRKAAGETYGFYTPDIFEACISELNEVAHSWLGINTDQTLMVIKEQAGDQLPLLEHKLTPRN